MTPATIVNKIWNYCHVLRDDGVSYGDYLEQLTYLVFLKMADEQTKPPFKRKSIIPKKYDWTSLVKKDGDPLEVHYRKVLTNLAKEKGLIGVIFCKSQNKIQDPAKLRRLVVLINEEVWTGLDVDVKGEIYEGLLERNAEDVKGGAGQYFTPRALIKSIVEVMKPEPGFTISDPACGTGGFLLSAHAYLTKNYKLSEKQREFLIEKTFFGNDIVDSVVRLCVMNLYLHGISGDESPITVGDSLTSEPSQHYDIVLTNPPFGRKSTLTITNEDGKEEELTYERKDFWATTSNKQLNFIQHINTILKADGRAAVVVPDNVLFEGGVGETIRRKLLETCDVHTLLRLPTGIFYAQGVKANVIFFDKKKKSNKPWTKKLWIYDFRTNIHFTLKTNRLKTEDLEDFIKCYKSDNRQKRKVTERFKAFSYEELIKRDKASLDIFWLKDKSLEDSENLPEPEILSAEIAENLESAFELFNSIAEDLEK